MSSLVVVMFWFAQLLSASGSCLVVCQCRQGLCAHCITVVCHGALGVFLVCHMTSDASLVLCMFSGHGYRKTFTQFVDIDLRVYTFCTEYLAELSCFFNEYVYAWISICT